jgi:hypothetical protein
MSYTIVDDNGVIQIRASIVTADEMHKFMSKLFDVKAKLIEQESNKQEKPAHE